VQKLSSKLLARQEFLWKQQRHATRNEASFRMSKISHCLVVSAVRGFGPLRARRQAGRSDAPYALFHRLTSDVLYNNNKYHHAASVNARVTLT
jgi:hypothetical protein